jgi:hypothetical protein
VGGLAWTFGGKPGFLVVVAAEHYKDNTLQARKLRVLAEKESAYLPDLGRYYDELQEQFKGVPWFGDTNNRPAVSYLINLARKSNRSFSLSPARYFDDPKNLDYYCQLIEGLRTRGILHLDEHSTLRGYLMGLSPEELKNPALKYPPIAALGYALAYLYDYEPGGKKSVSDQDLIELDEIWRPV